MVKSKAVFPRTYYVSPSQEQQTPSLISNEQVIILAQDEGPSLCIIFVL